MAPLVCAVAAAMIAMAMAGLILIHRLQRGNRRIYSALDNMSEGLCMFDARERLLVCNQRYRELYDLPAEVTKRGGTLQAVLDHRIANGNFARDPLEYRREIITAMRENRSMHAEVMSPDGTVISINNRPTGDGGWVAMHEDISNRRKAERERASMREQEQRRTAIEQAIAAFRRGVEEHLRSVADGAQAMRSTAAALFASSGQTSQSADGAVTASNEASTNVEIAAVAADELTGSINEIGRQLASTTEIVRTAVGEAQGHQRANRGSGGGGAEDWRRDQAHPRHRRADQPARA